VTWAAKWEAEVLFAVEDCRHLTRRLEADLLRADHRVVRVPTRLMARARRSGRQPGKSDPIDALAVLREPDLPTAHLDGPTRAGQAAVRPPPGPGRRAHQAVQPAALAPARARPELHVPARGLRRYRVIDELAASSPGSTAPSPSSPGSCWPAAAS
jgi:transposase